MWNRAFSQTTTRTGTTTMARYAAQEDGSITYADADDIKVVEPITHPVQTAGGYTRHEPDHELAALMAAAPDLLAALRQLLSISPFSDHNEIRDAKSVAREAIKRATNPDYVQNSIGQTRAAAHVSDCAAGQANDSTES